jgi:alkaline phosphatase
MNAPGMIDYPALAKAKKDEVVIFAWAMFKSKAARNKANQALMTDPQMIKLMDKMNANPIMDCKRMAYGGFNVIVKA